ncbi:alanyl-tRNA editing protein [Spirochaeta dissipatitropha]
MHIQQTNKVYYTDPYLTKLQTEVIDCRKAEGSDSWVIYLAQTIFYPAGGGQPSDKGTINGKNVVDVRKDSEGGVLHVLESPGQPFCKGDPVQLEIDWGWRFDYMQQHSGQHLISAVLKRTAGADTVSVAQSSEITTIEINKEILADSVLHELVSEVNRSIQRNLKISSQWLQHDEIDHSELRRPTDRIGSVRLVRIENLDCVACAGIHAGSTGELAVIRLTGTERIRGRLRLSFRIGNRAVQEYLEMSDICDSIGMQLSSPLAELKSRVVQIDKLLQTQRSENENLKQQLAAMIAAKIYAQSGDSALAFVEDSSLFPLVARNLAEMHHTETRDPFLLLCSQESDEDSTLWAVIADWTMSEVKNFWNSNFPGIWKGGGKAPLFQGILRTVLTETNSVELMTDLQGKQAASP